MSNSSSSSSGIGFAGMLTILFIGLKLTHNIDWSWWWVLAPLWGGFALMFAFFAFGGVFSILALLLSKLFTNRKRNRIFR